jgi:hypothetical protein
MAIRLIFEAQGDELRLIRHAHVDMEAPGAPVDNGIVAPGVYAEVRDVLEQTLYQANLSSQMASAVEVFSPEGRIQRVDVPAERKMLVVVAPDFAEAKSLVVVRRTAPRATEGPHGRIRSESGSEQELTRVDLTGGGKGE